jgi:hypothetical protein
VVNTRTHRGKRKETPYLKKKVYGDGKKVLAKDFNLRKSSAEVKRVKLSLYRAMEAHRVVRR